MRPGGVIFFLWVLLAGCTAPAEMGSEQGRCYPNGTCNLGLVCLSSTCVQLTAAGDGELASAPDGGGLDRQADSQPLAPLSWEPCDTSDWPSGYPKPAAGVECTSVEVPIDHGQPAGPSLRLRVARHRAVTPTGKAVFQLAGGPGGTSVGQSGLIPIYLPRLRDTFDLVYVDQRGTGGSGYLGCGGSFPQSQAQWSACAALHGDKNLDRYLSLDAAHDLELVRKRLGYQKIYLRGGSYGTRLALEMVRQHESSLAAVVLDGVDAPDWDFFSDMLRKADRGIARLIEDCGKDAACTAVVPDLGADLEERRQQLRQSPRKILVGGQSYLEDEESFAYDLKAFVEDSYWRFRIPRAVHAAVNGDHKLWNGLMSEIWGATVVDAKSLPFPVGAPRLRVTDGGRRGRLQGFGTSYVAPGLYATVSCVEGLPNSPGVEGLKTLLAQQDWGALTGRGAIDLASTCGAWKAKPLEAGLRQPVTSSVKALLLSGELDFITPPEVAASALKGLSNGTHLMVGRATHSTMSVPCVAQIISDFLAADGEIASVDTSCLQKLPPAKW